MDTSIKKKKSLTYDDVADLCDTLDGLEIKITQHLLQHILQRGSTTTINKYLKEWKDSKDTVGAKLSRTIIRKIELDMDIIIQNINAKLNSEIIELQEQLEKSDAKNKSLAYTISNLEAKISTLTSTIDKKDNELQADKLLYKQMEENKKELERIQHEQLLSIAILENSKEHNEVLIKELKTEKKELNAKIEDLTREVKSLSVESAKNSKANK